DRVARTGGGYGCRYGSKRFGKIASGGSPVVSIDRVYKKDIASKNGIRSGGKRLETIIRRVAPHALTCVQRKTRRNVAKCSGEYRCGRKTKNKDQRFVKA